MPNPSASRKPSRCPVGRFAIVLVAGWLSLLWFASAVFAASIREAQLLYQTGEYASCIKMAAAQIERNIYLEGWRHVKAKAELALGQYAEAMATIEEGLDAYPRSIQMRLLAHEVFLFNGQTAIAELHLKALDQLARSNPRRYSSSPDRIALGKYFLSRGADARQILELCFDPVIKQHPDYIEGHLASAELALDKYDRGLAAEILTGVPETARDDPRYYFLLARAYASDDPKSAAESLDAALKINQRHLDSLLLQAEKLIDGEQYDDAKEVLASLREINEKHPIAWAYEAVLAHLQGDQEQERAARVMALATWSNNPEVDHTIGRKLSDKYRFAEGADYQRRALVMDSAYLPARLQLAQDLLRLGEEEEGWQLIHNVFETDGYNVVAHNLVTLHDTYPQYRILVNNSFRVRIEAREANIYGQRVLDLLARAKQTLCAKYDVTIDEPITVEIFPHQKDFAVRTFGLPGAAGFLGVCFGDVITANSPAALGNTHANWEAVLWHEFCHVVTLRKSRNKMPRWLSEGISVYEERQEDPTWGQRMSPEYRRMILSHEMAPLSELSSSFLAPKSQLHLQFAYYESSIAVQYMMESFGIETMRHLLNDLADGTPMNEALVRHAAPLGRLDAEFTKYITNLAEKLAPELSWDDVDLPPGTGADAIGKWLDEHPDNFAGLVRLSQSLLRENRWNEAIAPANRLRKLFPDYVGPGNAYSLLANAHRALKDVDAEREALEAWGERDSEAVDAYFRLMELGQDAANWKAVELNAKRMLAVSPLSPAPHRYLARAAEELDQPSDAIVAYQALLQFETSDPVNAHFRLAKLLNREAQVDQARREVLMALEDAPRFLAAHQLLLELVAADESTEPANGDNGKKGRATNIGRATDSSGNNVASEPKTGDH